MDKTATKIIELKNDGKSLRQIAKQVGTSHVAVKKRLDRLTTNETGNQESETHGNAIAEPVNGDCQAPPPDKGQLWDMGEYPELNHAVTEIDGLLMDIEQFFNNHMETPESITIETPNGWKIGKIRVAG